MQAHTATAAQVSKFPAAAFGLRTPSARVPAGSQMQMILAKGEELSFSLAHQGHEDTALPPALAAKTTHDLFQRLLERLGLAPQVDGSTAASLGETFDERKSFFAPSTAWWRQ